MINTDAVFYRAKGLASASKNTVSVIHRLGIQHDFGAIVDVAKLTRNKREQALFLQPQLR